ncbi:MAG: ribbon-helix-helix domain-containing protein [Caldimonas sp.]
MTQRQACHTLDDMRVNARLDEQAAEQVEYLVAATGEGVSHVLRESVAHYYRHVKAQRTGLVHLAKFIGKGDSGRTDIASNVKKYVAEYLDEKYPVGKR